MMQWVSGTIIKMEHRIAGNKFCVKAVCELTGQIDDGKICREHGPPFDHEFSACQYNGLMEKMATMKEDRDNL